MKELGVIIVITLSITAGSPPCNHTPPSLTNSQQSLVIVFVNGSNDCMYASVCYTRLHGPRHLTHTSKNDANDGILEEKIQTTNVLRMVLLFISFFLLLKNRKQFTKFKVKKQKTIEVQTS